MSDAQRPQLPADSPAEDIHTTDVDGNPIPSAETLEAQSLPAVYSRSPRLVRVVATSGGIGALVGFVLGVALPAGLAWGRLTAGLVLAVAGALAGALIAGVVVAGNEAKSAKHVAGRKQEVISDWILTHPDSPYYAPDAAATTEPDTDGKPA